MEESGGAGAWVSKLVLLLDVELILPAFRSLLEISN
jgi:hypothetical protein